MVELPDDLYPDLVSRLVAGANEGADRSTPYAVFVHNKRDDISQITPAMDFRELAQYRQGQRLAFTYASDNRTMSTYSSVYPLLLSSSFPSQSSTDGSVASINSLARSISNELAKSNRAYKSSSEEVVRSVLEFLARSYEAAGSGQSSFAADWWHHVDRWASVLAQAGELDGGDQVSVIHGCAGLPVPKSGKRLSIDPASYVSALEDRWHSPHAIYQELSRLEEIEDAGNGAEVLKSLDWEQIQNEMSLRTDSIVARVALASLDNQAMRGGWSLISEDAFGESYVAQKGSIGLFRNGELLPRPIEKSQPALILKSDDIRGGANPSLNISDFGILVPFKSRGNAAVDGVEAETLRGHVQVKTVKGCEGSFEASSASIEPEGLLLSGRLILVPQAKAQNSVGIEVHATGKASTWLVDKSSAAMTILRPDEVAIWAKAQTGRTKNKCRGPAFWRSGDEVEQDVLKLGPPGRYDVVVFCGAKTGLQADKARIDEHVGIDQASPISDRGFARGTFDATGAHEVHISDEALFTLEAADSGTRQVSPVISAALGEAPDTSKRVAGNIFEELERKFAGVLLKMGDGAALGCGIATTGRQNSLAEWQEPFEGAVVSSDLVNQGRELFPTMPTARLLSSPAYSALRQAYQQMNIPMLFDAGGDVDGVDSITISRVSLEPIPKESVEALVAAYEALTVEARSMSKSDQFWAKHPFSIALYPDGAGLRRACTVLLSPFHPVRLAWLWTLQIGLREAFEDGANPVNSLSLLDGTYFPSACVLPDEFGAERALMPVSIDPSPQELYIGWHACVDIVPGQQVAAASVMGRPLPIEGVTFLSRASVSGALNDFLRVAPQVQTIQIELAATSATSRSTAIDDGVLQKIRELARASSGLDGVTGVKVYDSSNRQGALPKNFDIDESLSSARSGFNVEWASASPDTIEAHVTFLEGSAARVAMSRQSDKLAGWLPRLPLRRIPIRHRQEGVVSLDYSFQSPAGTDRAFERALLAYERLADDTRYVLQVVPNLSGVAGRQNWLVAGDFGVDPQTLSDAASGQAGGEYILWDWRPTTTVRANPEIGSRALPYFVLASVPKALNTAITERLKILNAALSKEQVEERNRILIKTLAKQAVGLNTLLAIGHNQATGALGFFFALRSLEYWLAKTKKGETRVVVPVDAVDSFLRNGEADSRDGSRQRADLLAVRAKMDEDGKVSVVFSPIEIKHYGLTRTETEVAFPLAGESRLADHIEQLSSYQSQLIDTCDAYSQASGSKSLLLGFRLASVLDAAMQLNANTDDKASLVMRAVANGEARMTVGAGVLLWYQAGGTTKDGRKAHLEHEPGPIRENRVQAFIDPAAFDGEFWAGRAGEPHNVLVSAIEIAMQSADESFGTADSHTQPDADHGAVADGSKQTLGDSTLPAEKVPLQPAAETHLESGSASPASSVEGSGTAVVKPHLKAAELEKRYRAILSAFGEFKVKVERPSGLIPYREGPAFIEYSVLPAYGVSVNRIESQLENLKLRLRLASDAAIGCSTHRGQVLLTVPKEDKERYFVDAEDLWARWQRKANGFAIPLGEDITGQIIDIDLSSSNSPHLLIAGVTGSGKSEALLTMLHGATRFYRPEELELYLIDPKQTELNTLAKMPHTKREIGWQPEDAINLLKEAVDEMDRRYSLFGAAGGAVRSLAEYVATGRRMPRWILVLDEYADLVSNDGDRKKIEQYLQRLSQKARAAGIHLLVSTQKPVVKVVNTVVKGNLPGKIALRVNTQMESRVILDEGGAEQLAGKGDAIIKAGSTRCRIQFARYDIG